MLASAVAVLASSSLIAPAAARAVRSDQAHPGGPQPQLGLLSQLDPLLRQSRLEPPQLQLVTPLRRQPVPELRDRVLSDVLKLRGGKMADGNWVNWDGKLRGGHGWLSGGRPKAGAAFAKNRGAKKRRGGKSRWPFEHRKHGSPKRAQARAKRQRQRQRNATARTQKRLLREQLGAPPARRQRQRNATARPLPSYRDQYLGPHSSGWRRVLGRMAHAGSDPQFIARAVVDRTNAFRAEHGKAPLAWNDRAASIAKAHAEAMADGRAPFSHDGSQGRFAALPPHVSAGENLFQLAGPTVSPAAKAVEGWKESPGHRKNLLGGFTSVGVGVAQRPGGRVYMTQILYRAAPRVQIQGVQGATERAAAQPLLQGAVLPAPMPLTWSAGESQ